MRHRGVRFKHWGGGPVPWRHRTNMRGASARQSGRPTRTPDMMQYPCGLGRIDARPGEMTVGRQNVITQTGHFRAALATAVVMVLSWPVAAADGASAVAQPQPRLGMNLSTGMTYRRQPSSLKLDPYRSFWPIHLVSACRPGLRQPRQQVPN